MNVKRITRLLSLMRALQSGAHQNADGLAEQCGVSRRTVFRDIESLREAGVPVQFDNGNQKYRIDAEHFLPPTNLKMEEALAVVLLAERAEASGAQPLLASARDAAAKIEAGLPPAMQERLRALSGSVTLGPEPANPLSDKHDIHRTLVEASDSKHEVSIHYDCLTEFENYPTKLRVYHLMFHQRSWYAIGHSSRHKEVRTFNVGRILRAELLDSTYRVPRSFSIKKHLRNAWGLIPETGPDRAVHLRFSSLVAKNVAEVMWHPTQRCEVMEDGTLDYFVTVFGACERSSGGCSATADQVEVVDPPRLRKMVAQRLRNAAALYEARVSPGAAYHPPRALDYPADAPLRSGDVLHVRGDRRRRQEHPARVVRGVAPVRGARTGRVPRSRQHPARGVAPRDLVAQRRGPPDRPRAEMLLYMARAHNWSIRWCAPRSAAAWRWSPIGFCSRTLFTRRHAGGLEPRAGVRRWPDRHRRGPSRLGVPPRRESGPRRNAGGGALPTAWSAGAPSTKRSCDAGSWTKPPATRNAWS